MTFESSHAPFECSFDDFSLVLSNRLRTTRSASDGQPLSTGVLMALVLTSALGLALARVEPVLAVLYFVIEIPALLRAHGLARRRFLLRRARSPILSPGDLLQSSLVMLAIVLGASLAVPLAVLVVGWPLLVLTHLWPNLLTLGPLLALLIVGLIALVWIVVVTLLVRTLWGLFL